MITNVTTITNITDKVQDKVQDKDITYYRKQSTNIELLSELVNSTLLLWQISPVIQGR